MASPMARLAAVHAADAAYTAALQAAVSGHGSWAAVQAAKHAVAQALATPTTKEREDA